MIAKRVRLGMITPSSNTALEPATARMLSGMPDVSAHFARVPVTHISLDEASRAQFDPAPMLQAAELLADARCDSICWNGTSASWLGVERDRSLCEAIRARTGIPATTAVVSLLDAFRGAGVKRYGLVTPYAAAVQERIVSTFAAERLECVAERHVGLHVNFEFAEVPPEAIDRMVREVTRHRPDGIAVLCTNMDGASLAPALEQALRIPVFDSIAVALWGALRCAGISAARVTGWGSLFTAAR